MVDGPQLSKVAAATVFGWVLYDLAVVATTPVPDLVWRLLPGGLVAVGLGAIAGLLWGLHRALLGLTLLAAAGMCTLPFVLTSQLPLAWIWIPRVVLLLTAGAEAASWLAPRLCLPAVGTGLVLGAAGATVTALYMGRVTGHVWLVSGGATFALASARISSTRARRLTTAAAVVIPVLLIFLHALERAQLRRPDAPPQPSVAAEPGRPNLVMIVLDTVGARHLAPYGYERVTTPGIDAFARKCTTLYTQAYAASSWTLPSHASLFTGLYPSEHGAHHCGTKDPCGGADAQPLRADVPTLAEQLAAHGYQTAAIVANARYLGHELGMDRGFAHYDDRWGASLNSLLLPQLAGVLPQLGHSIHRSAERITNLALDWIAGRPRERPFFLFLNYMDSHFPYIPAPPYDEAFSEQQPPDPYEPPQSLFPLLYDRELLYLDEHVTRLLRGIEAQGLLNNTVMIITADHGEAFGEHGSWWHDGTLYEELLRVPLYVKGVGPCRSASSDARMTGLDVHRLALHEVGLQDQTAPAPPAQVIAELQGVKNPSVEPDRDLLAWMDGRVKWIVSSRGGVEAYNLDADPGEHRNLAADRDQVEQAQAYAARWWGAHPPIVTTNGRPREIDARTRERMRNLGY